MTKIQINEKILKVLDSEIKFDYPIEKAELFKDKIIILLDSDSNLRAWGQFPNLYGVDFKGKILWLAELPTTDTGDSYHSFSLTDKGIKAYAASSYECIIDPLTGKIMEKIFTK